MPLPFSTLLKRNQEVRKKEVALTTSVISLKEIDSYPAQLVQNIQTVMDKFGNQSRSVVYSISTISMALSGKLCLSRCRIGK